MDRGQHAIVQNLAKAVREPGHWDTYWERKYLTEMPALFLTLSVYTTVSVTGWLRGDVSFSMSGVRVPRTLYC